MLLLIVLAIASEMSSFVQTLKLRRQNTVAVRTSHDFETTEAITLPQLSQAVPKVTPLTNINTHF
jgi:hypothetical protein